MVMHILETTQLEGLFLLDERNQRSTTRLLPEVVSITHAIPFTRRSPQGLCVSGMVLQYKRG